MILSKSRPADSEAIVLRIISDYYGSTKKPHGPELREINQYE